MHTCEVKNLLNLLLIILLLIFVDVKTLIMLKLFLEQAHGRPTWPLRAGPALSRCNRCSCTGPRAMVFGKIVNFFQIILELANSVETAYISHC